MTGGCACGAVRFRLESAPYDAGWCHCRICQRVSGAPALAFATVPLADWTVTAGEDAIGRIALTAFGTRQFCTRCRSPLTMHVDHQPGEIDVVIAALDAPSAVAPGFHIFTGEAIAWDEIDDGLPRFAGFRPDTRGLKDKP